MVDTSAVLFALAGALALLLAAGLLALDFRHRANRAFAWVLGTRGLAHVAFALALLAPSAADAEHWLRVIPYLVIAFPFANLYFLAVYPRRRRGVPAGPWAAVPFLAGAAVVELWYVVAARPHGLDFSGPLALVARANEVILPAMALVFAVEASRAGPGPLRTSTTLISVGYCLQTAYGFVATLGRAEYQPANVPVALVLGGLVAVLAWNLRQSDAEMRSFSWRYLAAVAVAGLSGLLYVLLAPAFGLAPGFNDSVDVALSGVWRVAFPVAATYALARHQLFDIDLKVKRTVQGSTVAVAFIATYLLVSQGALAFLDAGAARVVGLAAVALLLAAIVPLRRLGRAVAESALPGVEAKQAYLDARKLEVYRAALEANLGPSGALESDASLARLRAELGISDRDHAVLEHALRAGAAPLADDLEPGELVLGRYRIEALLGEGGHGKAYRARDGSQGRDVVVKVIPATRRGEAMVREARALEAVRHPHVAALFDVEQLGGQAFIVMEHVEGGSLKARLAEGPLPRDAFAEVARGSLRALETVHGAGIVHRDVKPSNILLTREGQPKLADFGVAHIPGFETTAGGAAGAVGTIQYMSPEQAVGRPCTVRSDFYSLAASLFEAWTGKPYLEARVNESAFELQVRAAEGRAFPVSFDGPPALRAWFARALHPAPERRFASARTMREALERALAGSRKRSAGP